MDICARRIARGIAAFFVIGLAARISAAELRGGLAALAEPKPGKAMHAGSWDRSGMNGDLMHVKAGETVTLLDYHGAGSIRRFWMTIAPREDEALLSQVILRMYWDDDVNPSVECPLGAFFGVGFGRQVDYISQPLNETSGGYNCYWPMPFHKAARWTLTNQANRQIDAFYYNIDFVALDSLPADTRHFHAQFRRENPTDPEKNYTILDVKGAGHYVGTALFMAGRALYFLEGDEEVYIDGESEPRIRGTGTEDYFGSGWYYDRGTYAAPYHGIVIKDEKRNRVSTYRWHIEDPIPFERSIRFTIEHGTNNAATADYSSVAYFYLAGPAPKPPPSPEDLLPSQLEPAKKMEIPGAIEGESLKAAVHVTDGGTWVQDMGNWDYGEAWSGRSALFWSSPAQGSRLTVALPASGEGPFRLTARMAAGPDCATVRFFVAGQPAGTVDLFAPRMIAKEISLGQAKTVDGKVEIAIEIAGRNPASKGSLVPIDAFLLEPGR